MPAQIRRCNCSGTPAAAFQDKTYGQGNRVCNEDQKKNVKCTVCGTLHKA